MKRFVYYQANFRAEIDMAEDIDDAIARIDIPEGGDNNSTYLEKSFYVYEVEDIE
tara:strand:- start:72 stop:236 length:165 start_codon:yes stop_codon:yes gene_type:complete